MGLFPEDPRNYVPLPPSDDTRTPSYMEGDPVWIAIEQANERIRFEDERASLSQILGKILAKDLQAEAERQLGTDATQATYRGDFKRFKSFCERERLSYLPTSPEAVAWYLIHRAAEGAKPKALDRAIAAIKFYHLIDDRSYSFDDVTVRAALRFSRRNFEAEKAKAEKNK